MRVLGLVMTLGIVIVFIWEGERVGRVHTFKPALVYVLDYE